MMRIKICLAGVVLAFLCAASGRAASLADSTNDVYVIPFSHLDLMWGGTLEECLSRGCRIISKAVQIAQRHPEFRFLIEDEVFAANYVQAHRGSPELEQLKRLVKEGRIEVAPKWAEIYQNLPRGEALLRNLIYGKEYARQTFGVNSQVAVMTDIPGFTSQFPQMLAKSDIPYMVMTRMGPPDCSLFRWQALDKSSVLVWNTLKGYGWGIGLHLHTNHLTDVAMARIAKSVTEVQAKGRGPIYLGWGTDLFAPSENVVSNTASLSQHLAPLQFRLATPTEYFGAASQVGELPAFFGEIPSSWANILTSLCQLWTPTITAADTLVTAEKFAAINLALGYADYPGEEFESLWKGAIEAMDHNNFGQGGYIGDARKLEYSQTAILRGNEILRDALRNIAERVQQPFARSSPIVVFNPLSWSRDDVVQAHVSSYGDVSPGDIGDYRKAMRLIDETGTSVPFHVEQSYGTVSRAVEIEFIARAVPSLGYKTYFLVPAPAAETFPNPLAWRWEDFSGRNPKRVLGSNEVQNEFYRLTIDRMTGRVTLFDKELDRVVAKDMEIVAAEERGGNSISLAPKTGRTIIDNIHGVNIEESNIVRAVVRIEGDLAGVPVTQRLFLYGGLKRLDMETALDWQEGRLMNIEQLFPYEQPEARIRYSIPFGSMAGGDIFPNCGPRGGDEVSRAEWTNWRQIQDWIFAGTADWGLTVCADRQLMILNEGMIRAGMLRGTFSTTGFTREGHPALIGVPPAGQYIFRYSLSSGKGDWAAQKSYRAGLAFGNPLLPVGASDDLSAKSLPPTHSFCSLAADNAVVTALKKDEQSGAVVLHVVEMAGAPADTPVEFLGEKRRFDAVNLLEESSGAAPRESLHLNPYEISALRLPAK